MLNVNLVKIIFLDVRLVGSGYYDRGIVEVYLNG